MDSCRVPFSAGEAEYVEKRSRFLGRVWRVDSEEEARERIAETRRQFYDARHHCWCYAIRQGGVVRYSDDGEPQGTAGQPMRNVFQREDVWNVCCVVTRYFGGILLGAGGLTRAYGGTAKLALDAAGVCRLCRWTTAAVACPYPLYQRLRQAVERCGGAVEDTEFGADVVLTVSLPGESEEDFARQVTELSAGRVEVAVIDRDLRPGPRIP